MSRLSKRGGFIYYRAKVPADLRSLIGKREFCYSLRTSDIESACALSLEMSARQLRLCRVLRQSGPMMTRDQIDALVSRYMESFAENREQDALSFGRVSPEFAEQRRQNIAIDLSNAETSLAENDLSSVELLARDLARENGLHVDISSQALQRLCFRLLNARVDVFREDAKRLLPAQPAMSSLGAPNGKHHEPVASGPKLSELTADYLEYRDTSDPLRPKSRIEVVAAFAAMLSLMGDKPLSNIRNRDAQDYALKFRQLPKRWRQVHRGKSASEVFALTHDKGLPQIERATFNKEMGLVKAFWKWACRREERTFNPMDAVDALDVGNVKDKRHPFSEGELVDIAAVINAERETRPERYWIATILAYTGARLEEIAQLRSADVGKLEGITCIRITAEAGSLKNETSERVVPIHSSVLAKGFIDYVATRPKEGRLFFDDSERTHGYGRSISKWFGRKVTELKLENRAKKTLHSFRHTMIERLRRAGVDPVVRREITGHAHGDVEDQIYGSADGMGVQAKQEALEKVRLPI